MCASHFTLSCLLLNEPENGQQLTFEIRKKVFRIFFKQTCKLEYFSPPHSCLFQLRVLAAAVAAPVRAPQVRAQLPRAAGPGVRLHLLRLRLHQRGGEQPPVLYYTTACTVLYYCQYCTILLPVLYYTTASIVLYLECYIINTSFITYYCPSLVYTCPAMVTCHYTMMGFNLVKY